MGNEDSRRDRRFASISRWVLVLLTALMAANGLADYDLWWHLKTGQLIPTLGLPTTDWYSFTSADRPWIDVHWGFQMLVAAVHRFAGVTGLVLLKSLILALVVFIAIGPRGIQTPLQGIVWLCAILVMSNRFYLRPEILSLLFLAIYLRVLTHATERSLWLLPIVQVAWANVQSLFVIGPIMLAMAWGERLLSPTSSFRGLRSMKWVSILIALACFVSPYGYRNVLFLFDVWQKIDPEAGQFFRATIAELMDMPSFLADGGWRSGYAWFATALAALAVLGMVVGWREIVLQRELFRCLPTLVLGWLAWQSIRNGSLFGLVAGALTVRNLPSLQRESSQGPARYAWVLVPAVIGITFATGHWSTFVATERRMSLGPAHGQFAFDAMAVGAKPGMPTRAAVFHLGHASNYIYAAGPEHKVFMDPRLEVHSEEMLKTYRQLLGALEVGENWRGPVNTFGIDMIVASADQNLGVQATLLTSPDWRCVWWDPRAAVFIRSDWPMPAGVAGHDFSVPLAVTKKAKETASHAAWWNALLVPMPSEEVVRRSATVRLAQAVMARPSAPVALVDQLLWAGATGPTPLEDSVEDAKYRTLARMLISSIVYPADDARIPRAFVRGWSVRDARRLLARLPDDLTLRLVLADLLHAAGATDDSVVLIREMLAVSGDVRLMRRLRPELERLAQSREAILSVSPTDTFHSINTWQDVETARRAGRLGQVLSEIVQRSDLSPSWSREDRWRLMTTMLEVRPGDFGWAVSQLSPEDRDLGGWLAKVLSQPESEIWNDVSVTDPQQSMVAMTRAVVASLAVDREHWDRFQAILADARRSDLTTEEMNLLTRIERVFHKEQNDRRNGGRSE